MEAIAEFFAEIIEPLVDLLDSLHRFIKRKAEEEA